MADANEGVCGRPGVGDVTLPVNMDDPGRASREGDRPAFGNGEEERGGGPVPTNFFCVSVREKIACERDDCAFISVSFVRLMAVPFRMRLKSKPHQLERDVSPKIGPRVLHDFTRAFDMDFAEPFPDDRTSFILSNLNLPPPSYGIVYA